jgi:hypothetical protein
MPSRGQGWQRRIRSNIDIWRVILMTPAEAATGRKRARKSKLLYYECIFRMPEKAMVEDTEGKGLQ